MASWWRKYVMDQSPATLSSGGWQKKAAVLAETTDGSGSWDRRLADGDHGNAPNAPWPSQFNS